MIFKNWAGKADSYQLLEIAEKDFDAGFGYLGSRPPTAEEFNWLIQYLTLGIIASGRFWQPSTAYQVGQILYSYDLSKAFKRYECIVAGTSGTVEPLWPDVGYEIDDGAARWIVRDVRDARKLQTPRKINGVEFDGSKDIEIIKANNKPIATTDQIPKIAVVTGTVRHGETIPLPAGYTQEQCKWTVGMADSNPDSFRVDIPESGTYVLLRILCSADANRVVTAQTIISHVTSGSSGLATKTLDGVANYTIIGIK